MICNAGDMRLAERGGKDAKKRAVVAVARKLAILLPSTVSERRGREAAPQPARTNRGSIAQDPENRATTAEFR